MNGTDIKAVRIRRWRMIHMLRTDLPEIKTETLPGPKAKEQGEYTEGGR